jgi:hypothetical protein
MTRFKTTHLIAAGSASALLLLTACGSDDNSSANAEACDAWIAADTALTTLLFSQEGDLDAVGAALDDAAAAAPDEIATTITDLKAGALDALENEGDATDETLALYREAVTWTGENCDVETVDVTAVEYEYKGIPDELPTGYTVVNFANEGAQSHEALAFKINDGVTESAQELVELPEEEVFSKITLVNATFADPGGTDAASWNLDSPGRYAVVCFIPVGTVGETEGDGPPHFTEGMIQEFTVTS